VHRSFPRRGAIIAVVIRPDSPSYPSNLAEKCNNNLLWMSNLPFIIGISLSLEVISGFLNLIA
jgi:hypothetical protein